VKSKKAKNYTEMREFVTWMMCMCFIRQKLLLRVKFII